MNYHNPKDLQASFDGAVQLVYEAFPKQVHSLPLYKYWGMCQDFIPHGVHLGLKFAEYKQSASVKARLSGLVTSFEHIHKPRA
jgi:hypothetical protein